jgi:CheY-like chemotaxis protein
MAGENFSIAVSSSFIENFYGLADMMPPKEIELSSLNNAVKIIRQKIDNAILSQNSLGMPALDNMAESEFLQGGEIKDTVIRPKSILVVDDLGIITYQLDILFKKLGFDVTISKELYNAIDQYKKKDFGYVVLDLFIPTEREGFILLDEIKKLALFCKLNTKIIMMSASSKPEYKEKCLSRGADCYIEKTTGWQKSIIDACLNKQG